MHSITDAAAAHSDDMRERMIKYAVAMGIRMVCIILIFVVDGWFKIIAVAGAVFLPWIAVVIANGSDKAEIHSDALLDYVPEIELEASPQADPEPREATVTVFEGSSSTTTPFTRTIPDRKRKASPAAANPNIRAAEKNRRLHEHLHDGRSWPGK